MKKFKLTSNPKKKKTFHVFGLLLYAHKDKIHLFLNKNIVKTMSLLYL
jgi:hypothetical protein